MASAGLIGVLLVTVTLAYRHVSAITAQNNRALALSSRVSATLDQIPSALRRADHALQDLIAQPMRYRESVIVQHLRAAQTQVAELATDPQLEGMAWHAQLADMHSRLATFAEATQHLLNQYPKPGWLYPALPLIAGTMYDANTAFDTGLDSAITETASRLYRPGQVALYARLVSLRGLWRRLILDFRSSMIRFAGLPTEPPRDDSALRELQRTIGTRLTQLERDRDAWGDSFETAEIIPQLGGFASDWFRDYRRVRDLQASGRWRGDVQYIDTVLRPQQRDINRRLLALEQAVTAWRTDNTAAVRDAAADINYLLWIIAGLGMVALLLNYLILDRGLLRPVAEVSNALSAQADDARDIELPDSNYREINRLVAAFEDMRTQIQVRQHALEHQALHDELTGLPNRTLLRDRLEHGLRSMERDGTTLGLLLLDLDRFKEINDSLGHHTGDLVLQEVARRLTRLVRDSDTVARLGGDEFAVVLPGLDRAAATDLAARIAATLDQPYVAQQQPLYLGGSVGVVVAPEDGHDLATLLRRADGAMYSAKRSGRDYAFHAPDDDRLASQGLRLTGRLRAALSGEPGLELHYQPRLLLADDSILSVEALLRWRDEDGSWIAPERVVRVAEHTNLIGELTRWVLEQALADCARSRAQGHDLAVAINLSALNLSDQTLAAMIQAALQRHQLPASRLTVEITESAVMADPKHASQLLGEIAAMGVTLSIDDFGTGFSSLAYLSQLSVHELKIDKSFVLGMTTNEDDALIVRSIIELAHNLGLQVVAEGVEGPEALQRLRALGCDAAQGYLIGRPTPLAELFTQLGRRPYGQER